MVVVKTFENGRKLYIVDAPDELEALLSDGKIVIPCLDNPDIPSASWPHTEYAITDLDEVEDEDLFKIYQRVANEPWEILRTDRMLVRETMVEDVDAFYAIYAEPSITEHMEPLYDNPDDERVYTKNYIKDVYGFYGYGMWTVLDKNTHVILGRAGLYPREGYDSPELGFVIGFQYQGKGLAFEVCKAILEYGHKELEFPLIRAKVMPANIKSLGLLKKLGFSISKETSEDGMIDCEHRL